MCRYLVLLQIVVGVGCVSTLDNSGGGASTGTGGSGMTPVPGGGPGSNTAGSTGAGVTPGTMTGAGGSPGRGGTGGSQGSTPSTNGSAAYSDIPCNVAAVLSKNCSMCHGTTPSFGAPMSLIHAADFARKSIDGSRTVGQAVLARINDDAHPMPPVPNDRLGSTDSSALSSWIQAGAKASTCASVPGGGDGSGGLNPGAEVDPTGPGVACYDIVARTSAGGKFSVPNTPDLYHCFSYAPPWGSQKVHLISWRPLIDNKQVLHHWLLYNETSPVTDKSDQDCLGAHPNAQLVAGWAPGGQGNTLPADVGQDVAGAGFTLETHYNNTLSAPSPDASGAHVCVTTNLRKNEAGMHWLGTELILLPVGGDATGVCAPSAAGPITILSSTPHMHLQGRHMKTVINRANGTKDMLIDKPFDFNTQVGYLTPAIVMPGDTLTTTCTFGGLAIYGEGTNQEMCYNFVLAYPNGALSSASGLRKNGCTGL